LNLQQDVTGDDEGEEVTELDWKEGEGAAGDWNADGCVGEDDGGAK